MQGESPAPRGRNVAEVFFDECVGNGARPLWEHRPQADPARDIGEQVGGVADGVAQRGRVEVDEGHAVAREEDVVGLQVPVDRRGGSVVQAANDRSGDLLHGGGQVRTCPPHQARREAHVLELIGDGLTPRYSRVILIEGSYRPGNCAHGREREQARTPRQPGLLCLT